MNSLTKENLQYYLYLIIVFALPLTFSYQPVLMVFWILSNLILINKIKIKEYKSNLLIIFPIAYLAIHALGILYSNNKSVALSDIESKLSLLFIPLSIIFLSNRVQEKKVLIYKLFVFANLIATFICIFYATKSSLNFDDAGNAYFEFSHWPTVIKGYSFFQLVNMRYNNFSYVFLSYIHHPSYFSIYILFSIVILLFLIRSSKEYRFAYISLIVYFSFFIWLLASRAAYVTFIIIFGTFFIWMGIRISKKWILVGVSFIAIILSILLFTNNQIRKNITESIKIVNNNSLNKNSDTRLWLWKVGIEVFKENIAFGTGTGDAESILKEKYAKYNLQEALNKEYNTHNQYIDEAIKLGIFGLLLIIGWFAYALIYAIKKKDFLFFYFILIFVINFMFEVIFNRIAGVSFFAFFYSFLIATNNTRKLKF